MPPIPGGWEDLPDEVRERLEAYGLRRPFEGEGGPDARGWWELIKGSVWDDDRLGGLPWDERLFFDAWGLTPEQVVTVEAAKIEQTDGVWLVTLGWGTEDTVTVNFGRDSRAAWGAIQWYGEVVGIEVERGDIDSP